MIPYIYIHMETPTIYAVLITLITVLGSGAAWRYYEKRTLAKLQTENYLKDDYRERIIKMELLLERSSEEKEQMRGEILRLTAEVSELRIKVEFLEKENTELQKMKNL